MFKKDLIIERDIVQKAKLVNRKSEFYHIRKVTKRIIRELEEDKKIIIVGEIKLMGDKLYKVTKGE